VPCGVDRVTPVGRNTATTLPGRPAASLQLNLRRYADTKHALTPLTTDTNAQRDIPAANPSDETIQAGAVTLRFLVTGKDSGGSTAVFEFMVPAGQRLLAPAHSHDQYEGTISVPDANDPHRALRAPPPHVPAQCFARAQDSPGWRSRSARRSTATLRPLLDSA
jgi:hypothetical protein